MAIWGLAARAVMFAAPNIPAAVTAAGILGVLDAVATLRQLAGAITAIARRGEDLAAEEMVRLMRERGPDDTFRLERGTAARREGDTIIVEARAIRDAMADDYGPFVEAGTSDTEAQPFFWDTAREVLDRTGRRFEGELDQLASAFNA
jgi:hypothetical protein